MLRVSEVYEKQVRISSEKPDGSEYMNFEKIYASRECLLNTEYIVSIQPHTFTSDLDIKRIQDSFPKGAKFSTFVLDGNSFRASEIVVLGSFDKFCRLFKEDN